MAGPARGGGAGAKPARGFVRTGAAGRGALLCGGAGRYRELPHALAGVISGCASKALTLSCDARARGQYNTVPYSSPWC